MLTNLNFQYDVDYDYDTDQSCDSHSCYEEGICRCGTITNIRIKRIDIMGIVDTVAKHFRWKTAQTQKEIIRLYCLERVCARLTTDDFECNISRGYYGQEVTSVTLDYGKEDLEGFLRCKTIKEMVEFVLMLEYGYLHEGVQNKEWHVVSVPLKNIHAGNEYRKLDRSRIIYYRNEIKHNQALLGCLAIKDGDMYRIVDGYHRHMASKQSGKRKMLVVYCKML